MKKRDSGTEGKGKGEKESRAALSFLCAHGEGRKGKREGRKGRRG